jgi:hypothetical protein
MSHYIRFYSMHAVVIEESVHDLQHHNRNK